MISRPTLAESSFAFQGETEFGELICWMTQTNDGAKYFGIVQEKNGSGVYTIETVNDFGGLGATTEVESFRRTGATTAPTSWNVVANDCFPRINDQRVVAE